MPYNTKEKRQTQHKKYYILNRNSILDNIKKYRIENPDKVKVSQKKYYEKNKEAINKIRKLRWNEYYNSVEGKQKEKLRKKEYYLKTREKYKVVGAKYRAKNVEKIKNRHRIWYQENKKEINRKRIETRNSDKIKKLRYNVSALVREKLKRRLLGKNGKSVFSFLPYTLEEFMDNLEKQFIRGMNWNNYGKWHIDHKIADSKFDYKSIDDVLFQESWALENLQPMWAEDNWIKGNRY